MTITTTRGTTVSNVTTTETSAVGTDVKPAVPNPPPAAPVEPPVPTGVRSGVTNSSGPGNVMSTRLSPVGAPVKPKLGDSGPAVKQMQEDLHTIGHFSDADMTSGVGTFGPFTEKVVKAFQTANGLSPSGVYDLATQAVMRTIMDGVGKGDTGPVVKALQSRLAALGFPPASGATGAFDDATVEALKKFQLAKGLAQTGSMGVAEYKALRSATPVQNNTTTGNGGVKAAVALIKHKEGYHTALPDGRCQAYPDPDQGWNLPTIGWGTTVYPDGTPVKKGDIKTRTQAEEALAHHVARKVIPAMQKIPTWDQMNDYQRGALICFAYNLGAAFYRGADFASITRVCDSPAKWNDKVWIEEQFYKYRMPGTDVEVGLADRRRMEAALFCTPPGKEFAWMDGNKRVVLIPASA